MNKNQIKDDQSVCSFPNLFFVSRTIELGFIYIVTIFFYNVWNYRLLELDIEQYLFNQSVYKQM